MKSSLIIVVCLILTYFVNAQNPGSIPDSIKTYTILVMKAEKGVLQKKFNQDLEDAFKKYYTGPFELIGKADLDNPKYSDLSKYRYTLDAVETAVYLGGPRAVRMFDAFFYDRLQQKPMNRPGVENATNYIELLRKFGKMLEKSTK